MSAIHNPVQSAPTTGNDLLESFTSNFSRLTQNTGVSGHFETLISGVKNLLPVRKELPVTRIVDAIMDGGGPNTGVDDFLYIDPKRNGHVKPKGKVTFQDAIVFVVGGGNYLEYQNLKEYAYRSNLVKKRVFYGSTELLTARGFMDQMESLGKK